MIRINCNNLAKDSNLEKYLLLRDFFYIIVSIRYVFFLFSSVSFFLQVNIIILVRRIYLTDII